MNKSLLVLSFVGFIAAALAAYPTNTDILSKQLDQCAIRSQGNDCITPLKNHLEKTSESLGKIHEIREYLEEIKIGFDTLSTMLALTEYVPGIDTFAETVQITMARVQPVIHLAQSQVQELDERSYKVKVKADQGKSACDAALEFSMFFKDFCPRGQDIFNLAHTCVDGMWDGYSKSQLGQSLESLGSVLNDPLEDVNSGLGSVSNSCSSLMPILSTDMDWPIIDDIYFPLKKFVETLQPILDFFGKVDTILKKKFCLKNLKEVLNPTNWFGRRKRFIQQNAEESKLPIVRMKRELATALWSELEKSELCISMQDVLGGVNKLFDFFLEYAKQLLDDLLRQLPSFSLPGLPDFSKLDDFDVKDLPPLEIPPNSMLESRLLRFTWDCPIEIYNACNSGYGSVTFNCGKPLDQYNISGRKKRSNLSGFKDINTLAESHESHNTSSKVDYTKDGKIWFKIELEEDYSSEGNQ